MIIINITIVVHCHRSQQLSFLTRTVCLQQVELLNVFTFHICLYCHLEGAETIIIKTIQGKIKSITY